MYFFLSLFFSLYFYIYACISLIIPLCVVPISFINYQNIYDFNNSNEIVYNKVSKYLYIVFFFVNLFRSIGPISYRVFEKYFPIIRM